MRISLILASVLAATSIPSWGTDRSDGDMLFEFGRADPVQTWYVVNDTVMGGVSLGSGEIRDGRLFFRGEVSLENQGGFASVRSEPVDLGLDGVSAIQIRMRGDGKLYRLRLRLDSGRDGVAYEAPLQTVACEWTIHTVPLSELTPKFRGRVVRRAPAAVGSRIRSVGLMIADKQSGPFQVEVDWIGARK